MERKNLAIIILVILLTTSGFGNIILGMQSSGFKSYESKNVLRIACSDANSPEVLDPVDSWDDASNDMIRHVCDTLLAYDLTDPALPLEMRLATSYSWNVGMDELTVSLRNDVWFHDGSKFNATAVKFTFDRIMYFINWSGDLPENTHVCDPAVFFYDMLRNPILNRTEIIDDYKVKFMLNKPNGVFLSLLTYEACSILHPNSVDATEYLILGEDILIGTGPFKYIHLFAGEELRLDRWDLYWGRDVFWDRILWEYYPDKTIANEAFLNSKADYLYNPLNSFIPTFQAEGNFKVVELDSSGLFRYWGLNSRLTHNTNVRKAIAYAFNYSYFIEEIFQGYTIKAEQLLPSRFPYYNASFKGPYYNTTIARQAMLDACAELGKDTSGLTSAPVGSDPINDANWAAAYFLNFEIKGFHGLPMEVLMYSALKNDLAHIGINFKFVTIDWCEWPPDPRIVREIWYDDWNSMYVEPFNMVEPLLNNMSVANEIRNSDMPGGNHLSHDDPLIHQWLELYEETDPVNTTGRAQLLYKIQQRAINELYVLIPISFDKTYYVHHRSLRGVSYNIMGRLWLADSYYIPGIPTI